MGNYEIFLSYSSKDVAIAEHFYNNLNANNFPVFRDQNRLDIGQPWNQGLDNAIVNSKHVVILWSSNAQASAWVTEEINRFKNKNNGLIIFVNLDIASVVHQQYQAVSDILKSGKYTGKLQDIDQNTWDSVINKIRKAVFEFAGSIPIKRAVFTLTKNKLQALGNIDADTKTAIQNNYSNRYADWHPFGQNNKNIENLLDDYLYVDINQNTRRANYVFHWEDIDWKEADSKLWLDGKDAQGQFINANIQATTAEINLLKDQACVLVLDPFALNDTVIKSRFGRAYDNCIGTKRSLIMALNSFPLPEEFTYLRQQLQNDASTFYENYFEPQMVENKALADCFANTLDNMEVKRHLRVSLRNLLSDSNRSGSAFNNPNPRQ